MSIAPQHDEPMWAEISFVVILPYLESWITSPVGQVKHPEEASTEDGPPEAQAQHAVKHRALKTWRVPTLLGPKRSGGVGTADDYRKHVHSFYLSDRLRRAAAPSLYDFRDAKTNILDGWTLFAVERHEFEKRGSWEWTGQRLRGAEDLTLEEPGAFLALHFCSFNRTSSDVEHFSQALRRPSKPLADTINSEIAATGLCVNWTTGGFAWAPDLSPTGVKTARMSRNAARAFVISCGRRAAPLVERPVAFTGVAEWEPHEAWLYQLATGIAEGRSIRRPDESRTDAERGCFALGSARARVEPQGLAVLVEAPEDDTEAVRRANELQLFAHSRMLDVVFLALRQRAWLDLHGESLARRFPDESLEHRISRFQALEDDLSNFRNQRWFTDIPGRREATVILSALQQAFGLASILEDITREQRDCLRTAALLHDELRRKADEAEQRTRDWLTYAVAAFAPPSLVIALASYASQSPGSAVPVITAALASGVMVAAALILIRRRHTK